MKTYKITLELDLAEYNGEHTANWSAHNEQQAIAQAALYYTQNGARELKVLEISEVTENRINVAGTPNALKKLFDSLPDRDKRRE